MRAILLIITKKRSFHFFAQLATLWLEEFPFAIYSALYIFLFLIYMKQKWVFDQNNFRLCRVFVTLSFFFSFSYHINICTIWPNKNNNNNKNAKIFVFDKKWIEDFFIEFKIKLELKLLLQLFQHVTKLFLPTHIFSY